MGALVLYHISGGVDRKTGPNLVPGMGDKWGEDTQKELRSRARQSGGPSVPLYSVMPTPTPLRIRQGEEVRSAQDASPAAHVIFDLIKMCLGGQPRPHFSSDPRSAVVV